MDVFFGIENLSKNYKNAVVCIGNFDGIHFGHRQIVKKSIEEAKKINVKSLMVTFDKHPRIIFAEKNSTIPIPILNTNNEKNFVLQNTGLDGVLYLKSDINLLSIEPEKFLKDIIVDKINATKVIVGYDFRYGKDRKGNIELMTHCGAKYKFQVIQIDAITKSNEIVSSSIIRRYLEQGNLEKAEEFLDDKYLIHGKIVHGTGRGRKLGFPTANVEISNKNKLIPARGVYFSRLKIDNEITHGLCNIGVRPTFDEYELVIEVYIYENENVNLYNKNIEITLLNKMRDEIKYDNAEKLIQQMNLDKQYGLQLIKQYN